MTNSAILLLLAGLIGALSSSCRAAETAAERITIQCPATWPGPEHRGEKLSYANAWTGDTSYMGPEVDDGPAPGEVMLDCAYGPKGGIEPRHITVVIPGRDILCHETKGRQMVRWCDTAREADGSLGPIQMYIAEPVTPASRFAGFHLGQSVDEILAGGNGFSCGQEAADRLVCRRGPELVTLLLAEGHAARMEWRHTGTQAERYTTYHAFILRFGLSSDSLAHQDPADAGTWNTSETWRTPGQPVELMVRLRQDSFVIKFGPVTDWP